MLNHEFREESLCQNDIWRVVAIPLHHTQKSGVALYPEIKTSVYDECDQQLTARSLSDEDYFAMYF